MRNRIINGGIIQFFLKKKKKKKKNCLYKHSNLFVNNKIIYLYIYTYNYIIYKM